MTPAPHRRRALVAALVVTTAVGLPAWVQPGWATVPAAASTSAGTSAPAAAVPALTAKPLAGLVIALDPGHQLGNANPRFASQLAQKRFNGRVWKSCNTTGTSTDAGFPEATFAWRVALKLRASLRALGASVPMTRSVNSWDAWGPCTWVRGQFGAKVGARLMIQIHADGAPSRLHGFHVITPGLTTGWTDALWRGRPIWRADLELARAMRRGLIAAGETPSTYIDGAIAIRTDQMAMNYARIPTVTVETGNMRNPREARRMSSDAGRAAYARSLLRGIRTYLGR